MNVPAQLPQLPAHLAALTQNAALMGMNQSVAAGLSSGAWPRISLKGCRFRLQSPQGEEVVVPALTLDVIIVDAGPNIAKVYYEGSYDPNGEDQAPTCYSDNGVGPSSRAAKPQCGTCAACPMNVWGSKISAASGKQIKACTDSKKLAVLIAGNVDGPVFELRVPAASLKNLAAYIGTLSNNGIPAAAVVTTLGFAPDAEYPQLVFSTPGYVTPEQLEAVMEVSGTEEVDVCTGKKDIPLDPTKFVAPAARTPSAAGQQLPPGYAPPAAAAPPPQPAVYQQPQGLPPMPAYVAQPPAAPAPVHNPTAAAAPAGVPPLPPTVQQPATAAPPAAKRSSRRKSPPPVGDAPQMTMPVGQPPAPPVQQAPAQPEPPMAVPPFVANMVQPPAPAQPNAAHTIVPMNPPVANAQLAAMLDQAMKV